MVLSDALNPGALEQCMNRPQAARFVRRSVSLRLCLSGATICGGTEAAAALFLLFNDLGWSFPNLENFLEGKPLNPSDPPITLIAALPGKPNSARSFRE